MEYSMSNSIQFEEELDFQEKDLFLEFIVAIYSN